MLAGIGGAELSLPEQKVGAVGESIAVVVARAGDRVDFQFADDAVVGAAGEGVVGIGDRIGGERRARRSWRRTWPGIVLEAVGDAQADDGTPEVAAGERMPNSAKMLGRVASSSLKSPAK